MFSHVCADIYSKGIEYELTDSVMVSMDCCVGAVALSLLCGEVWDAGCRGDAYAAEWL